MIFEIEQEGALKTIEEYLRGKFTRKEISRMKCALRTADEIPSSI